MEAAGVHRETPECRQVLSYLGYKLNTPCSDELDTNLYLYDERIEFIK